MDDSLQISVSKQAKLLKGKRPLNTPYEFIL